MVDIYRSNAVANFEHGHRREFLAALINQMKWTRGAELGLRTGETFFHLLDNCPTLEKLYGVDNWLPYDELWATAEKQAENKATVFAKAPNYKKGHIMNGETIRMCDFVAASSLDFIFIDANHTTEAVTQDIQLWAPKVKPDGWIIGHDINWVSVYQALPKFTNLFLTGPDNCWAFPKAFIKEHS